VKDEATKNYKGNSRKHRKFFSHYRDPEAKNALFAR
jgi:hypothetical protein